MRRFSILWMGMCLVIASAAICSFATHQATGQDDYASRIADLETRVSTLESVVGIPSPAGSGAATQLPDYEQTSATIELSGDGDAFAWLTVWPGTYSATFNCGTDSGVASLVYSKDGDLLPIPFANDETKAVEFFVPELNQISIDCDAQWSFAATPS